VVDGEPIQIELDGSGFSSGGSTYFSFNLAGEKITDDTIEIRGQNFAVVEIEGVTYVKTTGDLCTILKCL
jgi:hypothetical protein